MFEIQKSKDAPSPAMRFDWPWKKMDVGDMVKIEDPLVARKAKMSCHPYANATGKKFSTRTIDGVLHVWRVS